MNEYRDCDFKCVLSTTIGVFVTVYILILVNCEREVAVEAGCEFVHSLIQYILPFTNVYKHFLIKRNAQLEEKLFHCVPVNLYIE